MRYIRFSYFLFIFIFFLNTTTFAQFTQITGEDFTDMGRDSRGMAWVDYNNDGYPDLYVGQQTGGNTIFKNNAPPNTSWFTTNPTGTSPLQTSGSKGVCLGDYDNDGDLDFLANKGSATFFAQNNNNTSYTVVSSSVSGIDQTVNGQAVAWADYNNDGYLDFLAANFNSSAPNRLYQNNGDGTFTNISSGDIVGSMANTHGIAWADYDNDGDVDVFIGNFGQANEFYQNNGDGTFTALNNPITTYTRATFGGSWGDYDNDGYLDLFVHNFSSTVNELYQNNGDGTFTEMSSVDVGSWINVGSSTRSAVWGDYDNDGNLDIFIANSGTNQLVTNNGDGTFTNETGLNINTVGGNSIATNFTDGNKDGFLDLAIINGFGAIDFLFQNTTNANNWVSIKLEGARRSAFAFGSNRSAFGSKVRVKSNGQWQMREVMSQDGYNSQGSLEAEFGLANASIIDSVHIIWASGIEQYLTNVSINQFIDIQEAVPQATITTLAPGDAEAIFGTNDHIIYQYQIEVLNNVAIFENVSFTLNGSFQSSDFKNNSLKLWYSNSNDFSTATILETQAIPSSGSPITFNNISPDKIQQNTTAYFWVTVDIADSPTEGHTIQASSSISQLVFDKNTNKLGSPSAAGVQTIMPPAPEITINSIDIAEQAALQGDQNHIIYQIITNISVNPVLLESIEFQTSGTYLTSDLSPNSFKLWYGTENNLNNAILLSTESIVSSGESIAFRSLNQNLTIGQKAYFWLTTNIHEDATTNNNISATILNLDKIIFVRGNKTGNLTASGLQIFKSINAFLNTISLSDLEVEQNESNHMLYKFQVEGSLDKPAPIFQKMTFALQGSFQNTDIQNNGIRIWASTEDNFENAQLLQEINSVNTGENLIFENLNWQVPQGQINYFWISINAAAEAIAGNTLQISTLPVITSIELSNGIVNGNLLLGDVHNIVELNSNVAMPNIFTPNNDGNNDFFIVRMQNIQDIQLQIFDRFGNTVYQTNDVNEATTTGWDGGQEPSGLYVWSMEVTFQNGKSSQIKGKVKIVR